MPNPTLPGAPRVLSLIELGPGQSDEVALAMELCEGMQCNHLLYRLSQHGLCLTVPAVAYIATGLFSALKYLENPLGKNRPLVHADISLENLMLTRGGEIKLIDFGIAAEDPHAADPGTALTSLHQTAGKRPYLPPEGMPRRGPSSQSDLYAAGVCFWELCTGSRFPVLPAGGRLGADAVDQRGQRVVGHRDGGDEVEGTPGAGRRCEAALLREGLQRQQRRSGEEGAAFEQLAAGEVMRHGEGRERMKREFRARRRSMRAPRGRSSRVRRAR